MAYGDVDTDADGDDVEPSAKSARIVVGIIIALVAVLAIVLCFLTQTTLVRALEFGAGLVNFFLGIVVCVL